MAPLVFFSLADGYMGSDKKEEDNADNRTEPSFIASTKKKSMSNNKGDGDASIIIPTPTKAGRLVYDSASGFVTQYIVANVCRKLHSSSFYDGESETLENEGEITAVGGDVIGLAPSIQRIMTGGIIIIMY